MLFFVKSATLEPSMFGFTRTFLLEIEAMSWLNRFKLVLTGLTIAAALLAVGIQAKAPPSVALQSTISLAELPSPGMEIYRRIHQGGPFDSEKDGSVFGNRERLLPAQKRGFYREYTVPTPGLKHRGVRRIVCGGQVQRPEICYYTADHYASFRQITP
ncbi:MAG: ribonuclease [Rhodoferax sp.]|nr:ribonuclease [Rhodoferax sp.]MDZ4208286.1 ribonuclease [Rhodoferax sp.]